MTFQEDCVYFTILWVFAALSIATDIEFARRLPEKYLWMRIRHPALHIFVIVNVACVFILQVSAIVHDNSSWWLVWIASVALMFAMNDLDKRRLSNVTWNAMKRMEEEYPKYCPVCMFVAYGKVNGFCKPDQDMDGHVEIHQQIAEQAKREAEEGMRDRGEM